MNKRKGSRNLDINGQTWNYFVGKRFIDIRGPKGQKELIPKEQLGEFIRIWACEWTCGDEDCPDNSGTGLAVMPGAIANYIRNAYV